MGNYPRGHREIRLEQSNYEVVQCSGLECSSGVSCRRDGERGGPGADNTRNPTAGRNKSRPPLFLHPEPWTESWSQHLDPLAFVCPDSGNDAEPRYGASGKLLFGEGFWAKAQLD
jgi:hypothetical protein